VGPFPRNRFSRTNTTPYVRRPVLVAVIIVVFLLGGSGVASAQPTRSSQTRIGVWVARSFSAGSVLGTLPGGRLDLLGLRYARRLIPTGEQAASRFDGPSLTYTADLIPVARLHIPKDATPDRFFPGNNPEKRALSTTGVGAYPLGLRVTFRFRERVRPFIAGHTGGLYFADPVPDLRGRRFNFAVGIGAGVQVALPHRLSLTLGYRYHHLSNGFRGSINPGLDANLLYLVVGTGL
jgi:opacity protein-like surface antigen